MSVWGQIKGFFRALRRRTGSNLRVPDSMARTLKESTHVRGVRGGLARASTEQQHEIVVEGHADYTESFEDNGSD